MDQFLQTFLNEANDNLANFEEKILDLENNPEDFGLISEALRFAHSIKGGASFFAYNNVVNLTHVMESSLGYLKENSIAMNQDMCDAMLNAYDKLKEMIGNLESEATFTIQEELDELEEAFSGITGKKLNSVTVAKKTPQSEEVAFDDANSASTPVTEQVASNITEEETSSADVLSSDSVDESVDKTLEDVEQYKVSVEDRVTEEVSNIVDFKEISNIENKELFDKTNSKKQPIYVYVYSMEDDLENNFSQISEVGELILSGDLTKSIGAICFTTVLEPNFINMIIKCSAERLYAPLAVDFNILKEEVLSSYTDVAVKVEEKVADKKIEKTPESERLGVETYTKISVSDYSFISNEDLFNKSKTTLNAYKYKFLISDDLLNNVTQITEVGDIVYSTDLSGDRGTIIFVTILDYKLLKNIVVADEERLLLLDEDFEFSTLVVEKTQPEVETTDSLSFSDVSKETSDLEFSTNTNTEEIEFESDLILDEDNSSGEVHTTQKLVDDIFNSDHDTVVEDIKEHKYSKEQKILDQLNLKSTENNQESIDELFNKLQKDIGTSDLEHQQLADQLLNTEDELYQEHCLEDDNIANKAILDDYDLKITDNLNQDGIDNLIGKVRENEEIENTINDEHQTLADTLMNSDEELHIHPEIDNEADKIANDIILEEFNLKSTDNLKQNDIDSLLEKVKDKETTTTLSPQDEIDMLLSNVDNLEVKVEEKVEKFKEAPILNQGETFDQSDVDKILSSVKPESTTNKKEEPILEEKTTSKSLNFQSEVDKLLNDVHIKSDKINEILNKPKAVEKEEKPLKPKYVIKPIFGNINLDIKSLYKYDPQLGNKPFSTHQSVVDEIASNKEIEYEEFDHEAQLKEQDAVLETYGLTRTDVLDQSGVDELVSLASEKPVKEVIKLRPEVEEKLDEPIVKTPKDATSNGNTDFESDQLYSIEQDLIDKNIDFEYVDEDPNLSGQNRVDAIFEMIRNQNKSKKEQPVETPVVKEEPKQKEELVLSADVHRPDFDMDAYKYHYSLKNLDLTLLNYKRIYLYEYKEEDNLYTNMAHITEVGDLIITDSLSNFKDGFIIFSTILEEWLLPSMITYSPNRFNEIDYQKAKDIILSLTHTDLEETSNLLKPEQRLGISTYTMIELEKSSYISDKQIFDKSIEKGRHIYVYEYDFDKEDVITNFTQVQEVGDIVLSGDLVNRRQGVIIFSSIIEMDLLTTVIKCRSSKLTVSDAKLFSHITTEFNQLNNKNMITVDEDLSININEQAINQYESFDSNYNVTYSDEFAKSEKESIDDHSLQHYFITQLDKINNGELIPKLVDLYSYKEEVEDDLYVLNEFEAKLDKIKSQVDEKLKHQEDLFKTKLARSKSKKLINTIKEETVEVIDDLFSDKIEEDFEHDLGPHISVAKNDLTYEVPLIDKETKEKRRQLRLSVGNNEEKSIVKAQEQLKVNVEILDNLLGYANDLSLQRNKLNSLTSNNSYTHQDLKNLSQKIDRITQNLLSYVFKTRLQTIDTLFSPVRRMVRTTAKACGKKANVTIIGTEIELDKSIIEALNDPMTHMIRNSIDHGLEDSETREKIGKDPTGQITVSAENNSGSVIIKISDDGGGIDANRLVDKAIEKGILTKELAADMTHYEKIDLIYHPGFSSKDEASEMSGRGVGMDVVRTNIERINGQIYTETELGKGTTFKIILPLTVSIVPILIFKVGHFRMGVSAKLVKEYFRDNELDSRIIIDNGREMVRYRNLYLPIVRSVSAFGINKTIDNYYFHVNAKGMNFILEIDEVEHYEEVLVKKLPTFMKKSEISSTTILSDGSVIPLMDFYGIGYSAGVREDTFKVVNTIERNDITRTYLRFRVGDNYNYILPFDKASYIYSLEATQVEKRHNNLYYDTINDRMLIFLTDVINYDIEYEPSKTYYSVTFRDSPKIGIVVNQVLKNAELSVNLDYTTLEHDGFERLIYEEQDVYRELDYKYLIDKITSLTKKGGES